MKRVKLKEVSFLISLVFIILILSSLVSAQGIVACWNLDETSGTTAADSAGEHTGNIIGNPQWVAGKVGNALSFDGDDSIRTGKIKDWVDFSVCGWIKRQSDTGAAALFSAGDNHNPSAIIVYAAQERLEISVRKEIGNEITATHQRFAPTPSVWEFFCAVWNNSGHTAYVYVNGELKETQTNTNVDLSNSAFKEDFGGIGMYKAGSAEWDDYKGLIDEVAVFDKPLTLTEIQQFYQKSNAGAPYCGPCGNNQVDEGEDCDLSAQIPLAGKNCYTVKGSGWAGTLRCKTDCTFDTSGCYYATYAPGEYVPPQEQYISTADPRCTSFGQLIQNGEFYCNETLHSLPVKALGQPCLNKFECVVIKEANESFCIEGKCSAGYKREIAARETYLQRIINLLTGKLPIAGAKGINSTNPGMFSASEIQGMTDKNPVSSVKISAKTGKTLNAAIRTEEYSSLETGIKKSYNITKNPPGLIYKYLVLETLNAKVDDIDSAEVTFRIPVSWFNSNKIDKTKVYVYRWSANWTKLTVSKENETSSHISYKANSPGFSIFAITGEKTAEGAAQQQTNATTGQPIAATCTDGIQNQGEEGADCGGPCPNDCVAEGEECGNGVVDSGETCLNCASDVKCEEGEVCKYGRCVKKPFPFWTVLFILIAGGIIGLIAYKKVMKAGVSRKQEIAKLSSVINYILNAQRTGEKEETIKENLLKAGWKKRQINLAFSEIKKQMKKKKV